jgi:hypothetical protein
MTPVPNKGKASAKKNSKRAKKRSTKKQPITLQKTPSTEAPNANSRPDASPLSDQRKTQELMKRGADRAGLPLTVFETLFHLIFNKMRGIWQHGIER